MKSVWIGKTGYGAQAELRNILPARFCNTPKVRIECKPFIDHHNYDVYMFSLLPKNDALPVIEHLKKQGKKILFGCDDDLWSIPESNLASKWYNNQQARDILDFMLDAADKVVVSTEHLKNQIKHQDITVVPNLLDLQQWNFPPLEKNGPIKFLYTGSRHHYEDANLLKEPIELFLKNRKCDCEFLFFGYHPETMSFVYKLPYTHYSELVPFASYENKVKFIDPVPVEYYPASMAKINADISLCNLDRDLKFNYSKSNLKFLESSAVGCACWTNCPEVYPEAEYKKSYFADIVDLTTEQIREKSLEDGKKNRELVFKKYTWQYSSYKKLWIDFFEGV